MSVSRGTVLVASSEHLAALTQLTRNDGEVRAFADADALRALDVITRERPAVIALDRLFASTTRGAALINRIKADPALTSCEIRIVAHDGSPAPAAASPAEPAARPVGVAAAASTPPLDHRGTRRAPRFLIVDDLDISIDGNPARLVDLSTV